MPEGAIYAVQKQVRTITAAITTVSQKILDTNDCRKGLILFNSSDWSAFITYGATSSLNENTAIIGPYAKWEMPGPAEWVGEVSAIRESGTGSIVASELL